LRIGETVSVNATLATPRPVADRTGPWTVNAVWVRVRSLLVLGFLLAGTVAPVPHQPASTRTAVTALAGVLAVCWVVARVLGLSGRIVDVATVGYGVAGTAAALLHPAGAALVFACLACLDAGARWPRRWAYGLAGVLSVGFLVTRVVTLHGNWPGWPLVGPVLFVLSAAAGMSRAKSDRLTARAEREKARAAALDERARIAREIHDILAHALAALTIQLETADALLEGGRVDQARASVRRAGQLAREGLTETRRAIGALRGDPVPLADLLDALVRDYRSTVDSVVSVAVTGLQRPLEPDVVLACYRTAQEALTNAAKHAPGAPIQLDLHFEPSAVRLSVSNGAPASSPGPLAQAGGGYGLAGLRERAELAGGQLESGPAGDGYRVGVTIPA
jgi:signal transduction histidine kinase